MTRLSTPLRAGVIGASPMNPGWAMAAHVPAIQSLPKVTLAAVSTSSPASAAAAAAALGVPAFSDPDLLIQHPEVDLVVIAVKVEHHHRLAAAAIAAGKPVFVEWPLGRTLEEAEDLAARAAEPGVRSFIGLQGRFSPEVRRVRDLVAQGALGTVLTTSLAGSGMIWGDVIPQTFAYTTAKEAGAGVLPVPMIHAVAVAFALGDIAHLSACTAGRRPRVRVIETGAVLTATAPDHIALSGALEGGALMTVLYRGAPVHGPNLRWEVSGALGDLIITADNGNFQVADLKLSGAWGQSADYVPVPPTDPDAGPVETGIGANVLRAYRAIAHDLRTGEHHVPDFQHAVRRHRLLAAIERAAATGQSQEPI